MSKQQKLKSTLTAVCFPICLPSHNTTPKTTISKSTTKHHSLSPLKLAIVQHGRKKVYEISNLRVIKEINLVKSLKNHRAVNLNQNNVNLEIATRQKNYHSIQNNCEQKTTVKSKKYNKYKKKPLLQFFQERLWNSQRNIQSDQTIEKHLSKPTTSFKKHIKNDSMNSRETIKKYNTQILQQQQRQVQQQIVNSRCKFKKIKRYSQLPFYDYIYTKVKCKSLFRDKDQNKPQTIKQLNQDKEVIHFGHQISGWK